MTCSNCREHLLEAASDEIARSLAGRESAHTGHLAECPTCRSFAERILACEAELAQGLSALLPADPASGAAEAAVREAQRRRSFRLRRRAWLGAAAIAGLLAVRIVDSSWRPAADEGVLPDRFAQIPSSGLEVEPLGDESVAVFEAADRDIVVLWFYQGRGE